MSSPESDSLVELLMKEVYGDWRLNPQEFPKPLPRGEAGESPSGQRRYLSTDAFGVLNFVTLATRAKQFDNEPRRQQRQEYLRAAKKLIDTVELCLGQPSQPRFQMAKDELGRYRGLRMGKTMTTLPTDEHEVYDGISTHCLNEWTFALVRYGREAADFSAIQRCETLIHQVHPAIFQPGQGMYSKLSVDLHPPRGARPQISTDLLTSYIMYAIVQSAGGHIEKEISELNSMLPALARSQLEGVSSDPYRIGRMAWRLQWLGGWPWAADWLAIIRAVLPESLDVTTGMQTPFRLYMGIIGAEILQYLSVQDVLEQVKSIELSTKCGEQENSAMNKVTLASALDPWAFFRFPDEPILTLQ